MPDAEEKYEPNLLNPDYWGHGDFSFIPEELCPANRNNPLFGARREYVLRRMRIVATVSDIELNDEGIIKMRMTVTVEPSTSNRSRPRDVPWGDRKDCSGFSFLSGNVEQINGREGETATLLFGLSFYPLLVWWRFHPTSSQSFGAFF